MAAVVWRFVERKSVVRRDDPATWGSYRQLSFKSLKRNPVFAPLVDSPAVRDVLDAVFGEGGWRHPKPGARVLLTFPSLAPWVLPHWLWHIDYGFERATWPAFAVNLFACVGEVEPRGGATLALAGSHRLVDPFAATLPPGQRDGKQETWSRFMRQDPWLHELTRPGEEAERTQRLLGARHEVDGVPVEIVEMAGEPGDVFLTHLHVFHCAAPNVNDEPRVMLAKVIWAGEAAPGAR